MIIISYRSIFSIKSCLTTVLDHDFELTRPWLLQTCLHYVNIIGSVHLKEWFTLYIFHYDDTLDLASLSGQGFSLVSWGPNISH